MKDEAKTKEQLKSELTELRQRVAELEAVETERKQAEEALQESEEKYRHLFDDLGDAAFLADVETGLIVETNQQGTVMLGKSHDEIVGMHQSEVHPPDKADEYRQKFATHIQKGHAADHDGEVIRKDGTIVPVRIRASPLTIRGRRLILGLFRDITEHKRAEEALLESEQNFHTSLDNSPLGTRIINAGGETIYANRAILDIYNYSSIEEFKSIPAAERHTLKSYAERQERVRKREAGEPVPDRFEQSIIRKDGEVRNLEVFHREVLWGGEKQFQLIYLDITERKEAEEREKELQKELSLASRLASVGELAAGVAHEINNPLTGILAFSERLLRKSTDEKASRDLKRIHSEAGRAARVVGRLLTFARRREPKKENSDVNHILRRALQLRAYELKTSNIEVETDLTPNLPRVMADFYQIQEVFLNIIMNAEQAMAEADCGGKLGIKTQEMKNCIRISFTDDGPGISAEHLEKVFDPFFTAREKEGGTGLGLSVCHGIVEGHDGRIYAKSKPGKGATFVVELPLTGEKVKEAKQS